MSIYVGLNNCVLVVVIYFRHKSFEQLLLVLENMFRNCYFVVAIFIIIFCTARMKCLESEKKNAFTERSDTPFYSMSNNFMFKMAKNYVFNQIAHPKGVSQQCADDVMYFLNRLNESWAIKSKSSQLWIHECWHSIHA